MSTQSFKAEPDTAPCAEDEVAQSECRVHSCLTGFGLVYMSI